MTSTAIQPAATPQHRSSDVAGDHRVTAREWFASGSRRPYDPIAKTMVETAVGERSVPPLHVFEKVVAARPVGADARWLTMLPGSPDGSYGYAQVDRYLGQGDSDKPARHRY